VAPLFFSHIEGSHSCRRQFLAFTELISNQGANHSISLHSVCMTWGWQPARPTLSISDCPRTVLQRLINSAKPLLVVDEVGCPLVLRTVERARQAALASWTRRVSPVDSHSCISFHTISSQGPPFPGVNPWDSSICMHGGPSTL